MIQINRELAYASTPGFRPLALDLYVPENPAALCVYLHGGGWRVGSRTIGPGAAATWFFEKVASLGLAVASVDYRLSGEASWPAQRDDVAAALLWLRGRLPAYQIGCERFVVWGVSAGAQLAAIAALTPGTPIDAAVLWYPPTDLDALAKDIEEAGGRGDRSADSREGRLVGGALDAVPELVHDASPINHVHPGAPPFLLLHGDADLGVPPRQSERLACALRSVGTPATVELVPGASHMFPELDDAATLPLIERSVNFLLNPHR